MEIKVNNVSKVYQKKHALAQLDFSLDKPKIYGLLGRNGAGKTTIMQLLAGFMLPTKGEVTVDGQNPFDNQKIMEAVCLISEGDNFKKDLKVKNVLMISSLFYPTWDQKLAEQLLAEFSLDPSAKVKTLSKGMESALGIIVGLSSKAPITIFDEPYIGLDASSRTRFYELLIEQYQEQKRMIIFSTHLIDEVSALFEEVLIMDEGKVILQEETDRLRERCYSITGSKEKVEKFIAEKQVIHQKMFMGEMTAVLLEDDKQAAVAENFVIESVPIQQAIIYLTSRKGLTQK
ncbi:MULTISPECIES: ABC transporter ATP-binding protein [Paraliobacillus]|uniref:ABC transporter ATP-binding protein n=1 Tax=Paraliobacillus TaxID=200903 RepID=UPI000DD375FF|nr:MULTISPECIES: ABC transporter ATP-binding protein [Paraliobacillus]